MSRNRPWLTFERFGGSTPRDDEALEVAEDGSFTARRTIGGPRIGSFGGRLSKASIGRLRSAVEGVAAAAEITIPTPLHGATEVLSAAATPSVSDQRFGPKALAAAAAPCACADQGEVIDHPLGAVVLVADARTARLVHTGTQPIDVDLGSVRVRVIHMGVDETVRARWNGRRPSTSSTTASRSWQQAWVTAGPGWSAAVPFDHSLTITTGEWLQVWVEVAIRAGGAPRDGRLYVPVLADA
jgi:hypothetical protein